jgi:hypothetical protein
VTAQSLLVAQSRWVSVPSLILKSLSLKWLYKTDLFVKHCLQEQSRDLHDTFHSQLERAEDGFSLVADYFGRGVFNKLTVITDSPEKNISK